MHIGKVFLYSLIGSFISLNVMAQAPTLPSPAYVVDTAHVLKAQTVQDVTQLVTNLAQTTNGPEVAICVVESIAPWDIETYGIKLAEYWKVGKKGLDNGVILIVAVKERKVRIEVGRGAESMLTDSTAGRILQTSIIPYLKQGDWDGGVVHGVQAIVSQLQEKIK